MSAAADLAHCREAIRHGSLSFHAASRLLPGRVRDPALVLYAFCRLADDAVDLGDDKAGAVTRLGERLDRAYAGRPINAPADRAFADVVARHDLPRALPDALIEGLAWDAEARSYATLSDLRSYAARVAAAVGAMMCVLMGVRRSDALARACDLGVAMQLTNIARDVGEDARAGRLYLPETWLDAAGLTRADLMHPDPALRGLVVDLLAEADRLYRRAETGIALLPVDARPGIYAARHVYAAIGGAVARNGHDSITRRARTGRAEKAWWLTVALGRAAATTAMPRSAVIHAAPLAETRFLVEAAAQDTSPAGVWGSGRAGAFLEAMAQLRAEDDRRRGTA